MVSYQKHGMVNIYKTMILPFSLQKWWYQGIHWYYHDKKEWRYHGTQLVWDVKCPEGCVKYGWPGVFSLCSLGCGRFQVFWECEWAIGWRVLGRAAHFSASLWATVIETLLTLQTASRSCMEHKMEESRHGEERKKEKNTLFHLPLLSILHPSNFVSLMKPPHCHKTVRSVFWWQTSTLIFRRTAGFLWVAWINQ